MQCKWMFTKRLIFSTLQENAPCYGNNHTKNASLAAIARYISITTIYTEGYLQVFNAGHFYSSKRCHDRWRKKHWITMVFNETTNYNFISLSKQGRTQLIYSTELTEHVFENLRENCPVALPLLRDQLARLVSITWNSGSQTFMSHAPVQKTLNTCGPLLINKNT